MDYSQEGIKARRKEEKEKHDAAFSKQRSELPYPDSALTRLAFFDEMKFIMDQIEEADLATTLALHRHRERLEKIEAKHVELVKVAASDELFGLRISKMNQKIELQQKEIEALKLQVAALKRETPV